MSNESKSVVQNQFGETNIGVTLPIGGASGPIYITPEGKKVFTGAGAPTQSAPIGSFYLRSNGSSIDQFLYINTDGSTGWTVATLSGGGGGGAVATNFVYVATSGSDTTGDGTVIKPFATYAHALASITTASSSNLFAIVIAPGTYSESTFEIKPNISMIGSGSSSTSLRATVSTNIVLHSTWSGANASSAIIGVNLSSTGLNLDASGMTSTGIIHMADITTTSACHFLASGTSTFIFFARSCNFSNQIFINSAYYYDYGASQYTSIVNVLNSNSNRGGFSSIASYVNSLVITSTSGIYELDISCVSGSPISSITATGAAIFVALDSTTYVAPTLSGGAALQLLTTSNSVLANYSPSNYTAVTTSVQGHLHGIDNALGGVGGNTVNFSAYQSPQQTIPNNAITKVTLNQKQFDTGGYFNTSTSRYTPLVPGKYIFSWQGGWSAPGSATANVKFYIYKNGSSVAETLLYQIGVGVIANIPPVVCLLDMNGSTDYIEVYAFISGNSGGTLNINNAPTVSYLFGSLLDQKASLVTPSTELQTVFYSTKGSDIDGQGTIDFPYATPLAALTHALTLIPTFDNPVLIQGDPGKYNITTSAMIYPNIYYTGLGVTWNGAGTSSITLAGNSSWTGSAAKVLIKDIQLNGSLSLNLDSTGITSFNLSLTIGDGFIAQKACTFKKGNAGHIYQLSLTDTVSLGSGGFAVTFDGVDVSALGPHQISPGGNVDILTTNSGCSFLSVGNVDITDVTITTSSAFTVDFSAFAGNPIIIFAVANVNNSITISRDATTFSSNTGYAGSFPTSIVDQNISQLNAYNPNSLNFASTIAWDTRSIPSSSVILTGNALMGNPTGLITGGIYVLNIIQDATGSRSVTWDTHYKFPMGTPSLNSAANANTPFQFYSPDGSLMICMSPAASSSSTLLNTIFVSKKGSDSSGTGTIDLPFLTIAHAVTYIVSNFTPSTSTPFTVSIDSGTYSETALTLYPNVNLVGAGKRSTFISNSADITLNAAWEGTTAANCDLKGLQIAGVHTLNIDTTGRTTIGGFINLEQVIVVNPPTFKQGNLSHNLVVSLLGDVYLDLTESTTTIDSITFNAYGPFQISSGGTTAVNSTVTQAVFTGYGDLGNTNYVLTSSSSNAISFINIAGTAIGVSASGPADITVTRDGTTWTPGLGNSTHVSDNNISEFYRSSPNGLTDASTVTWDLSQYPSATLTTAAARTINFSGLATNAIGQRFFCFLTSNGFNSTWNSNFIFPNGQPDTTRSATYLLVFQAISSTQLQLVNSFSQWVDVSTTSITMVSGNIYYADNASQVTLTLPATLSQNDMFEVIGKGAGGWKIAQASGQTVNWTASVATTTGVSGSLQSTDRYDVIRLRAISSTNLVPSFVKGNITVT